MTTSTSGCTTTSGGFCALAPEIQRAATARLAWVALVYSAGYLVAFASSWGLESTRAGGFTPRPFDLITATTFIALGLVVFLLCRGGRIAAARVTGVAFWFEILGAVGINMNYWGWEGFNNPESPLLGIPWVCVWILLFPSLIPARPRRTLVAGLAAAASGPLVMAVSAWAHGVPDHWGTENVPRVIVNMHLPAFIATGVAHWIAVLSYQVNREVTRARRLGSYELIERIGIGGMGEVWRAKHRLLVRPAAVKLIPPAMLGSDAAQRRTAIQRFEREAQATATLSSPHTVEVYDFGVTDDGVFYYVMEYLQGLDLNQLVKRHGPVPPARAVHLLRQICHSLTDAHQSGLVHRDIKPANIIACRRGAEYDFVKVLDFGLVAARCEDGSGATRLTLDGIISGTPAFMAPEQVSEIRRADSRADIYAVGCVAYWLLTGTPVFEGASMLETLVMHAKDSPVPPSQRSEERLPPILDDLVLACLEKDAARRPASAAELAWRLAACEAVTGVWTGEHARDWWLTHHPDLVRRAEPCAQEELAPVAAVVAADAIEPTARRAAS